MVLASVIVEVQRRGETREITDHLCIVRAIQLIETDACHDSACECGARGKRLPPAWQRFRSPMPPCPRGGLRVRAEPSPVGRRSQAATSRAPSDAGKESPPT